MSEVVHVDLDAEEAARREEAVQRMMRVHMGSDVSIRLTEMSEGRYGIGAHNSSVEIVFANQSLWGCQTQEALAAGIEGLVAADPRWSAHYERRAREGLDAAQRSYDAYLAAMTDDQRREYHRKITEFIAQAKAKQVSSVA